MSYPYALTGDADVRRRDEWEDREQLEAFRSNPPAFLLVTAKERPKRVSRTH